MKNPAFLLRRMSLAAAVGCCLTIAAPHRAIAAPDHTLGMALLGAVVQDSGGLLASSGVTKVTHGITGGYELEFDRDIEFASCIPIANPITAIGSVSMSGAGPNLIDFFVRNAAGTLTDMAFSVMVFCTK